ncbi:MAG: hypothetical protein O3C34_17360 [Proteobacteria bacterium]|nr:hypothetical protein [Pseudomonadota bacterium]
MDNTDDKQPKVVGIYFGPAYLEGLYVRIAELQDGTWDAQEWDESKGWIGSELTHADFYEAIPITPEEMRKVGIPED